MEKKRSIGVTIFGIIIIATALLSLPALLSPKSWIEPYTKPFGIILYVLSFPLFVFELVLGINIFKLKEWARKYLVILTAIYIVSIFVIPRLEDKNYEKSVIQKIKQAMQQGMLVKSGGYAVYHMNSTSGESILMRADYALPERSIKNIAFRLVEQKPDGQYKYEFVSQEGERIKVDFFIKGGTLSNVQLDTDFRPLPENRQLDTLLTLLSVDEKKILFTFSWNNDGSVKNVSVKPAVDEQNLQVAQNAQNLSPEQKERLQQFQKNAPGSIIKLIKTVFYGGFLLLYAFTLFFFTRPKVREQFS